MLQLNHVVPLHDIATVFKSGQKEGASLLEIVDCSKRMAEGNTKDVYYIASLFVPHIEKVGKDNVDLIQFDGASNVQKAGRLLSVDYPRITCIHGAEHLVHLFFGIVARQHQVMLMMKFYRRFYHYSHGPHHSLTRAFMMLSAASNKNSDLPILLPKLCTLRFGIFGGCFLRWLRLQEACMDWLMHSATLSNKVPVKMKRIMQREDFWQTLHVLCKFTGEFFVATSPFNAFFASNE